MKPTRRDLLVQLTLATALAACKGSPDSGQPPGDSDPLGDSGGDSETDSAGDSGEDSGGGSGSDSGGGDSGEPQLATCDQSTQPTPADCRPTSPDGEGPYYRGEYPERLDLNPLGEPGDRLLVDGRVLDAGCLPVEGAVVDLWAANPNTGLYDMTESFQCAGRAVTAADGSFCFDTLMPQPYPDGQGSFMPAHLHLKVLRGGTEALTTQVAFEDDPYLPSHRKPADLIRPLESVQEGVSRVRLDIVLGGEAG